MNRIQLCNAAISGLLSRNAINSLDDATAEARAASALYDLAYGDALTAYRWSFAATTTAALAKSVTETPDEREVYPLPVGWVTITRVFEGGTGREVPYRLEGNSIVAMEDVNTTNGIYATYVAAPAEETLPAYFNPFFVLRLAHWLAMPLTMDKTLSDNLYAQSVAALSAATFADATSAGTKRIAEESEYTMIAGR